MQVYHILHKESGDRYIGQTTRPKIKRWREHLYPLRKGNHHNRHLQAAWNKYGEKAFIFEIIKYCSSLDEMNKAEQELIETSENTYNLAAGGNAFIHKDSAKLAIGEANKKPVVGMNIKTFEIREYASAVDTALHGFGPACVRKCASGFIVTRKDGTTSRSMSHKGWVWFESKNFDKDMAEKTAILARRSKVRKERSILGMDVKTNEIIEFKSCSEAARAGFRLTTVHRCCVSKVILHRGFVWVYADSNNPQSLLVEKAIKALASGKTGPKSWQVKDE